MNISTSYFFSETKYKKKIINYKINNSLLRVRGRESAMKIESRNTRDVFVVEVKGNEKKK
jgi:hypothetical protein